MKRNRYYKLQQPSESGFYILFNGIVVYDGIYHGIKGYSGPGIFVGIDLGSHINFYTECGWSLTEISHTEAFTYLL